MITEIASPRISFVLPAHNEAEAIGPTLAQIQSANLTQPYEIIVVDNNCTDATAQIATDLGARVVREPIPGYGSALMTGIRSAEGRYVITGDADGTYPFQIAPQLIDILERNDFAFLNTNRRIPANKDSFSPTSQLGNALFHQTTSLAYPRQPFYDILSGMWVFHREPVSQVIFNPNTTRIIGMPFSNHIKLAVFHSGLPCGETAIPYHVRAGGRSKINIFKDGIRTLAYTFAFRPVHQANIQEPNPPAPTSTH